LLLSYLDDCYYSYFPTLFSIFFFFFHAPATTEIYTLSLHDALPISRASAVGRRERCRRTALRLARRGSDSPGPSRRDIPGDTARDRKSTRLNSSHQIISYAVFCLKKKKKKKKHI